MAIFNGKSPFLLGKSPFLIGKSVGSSPQPTPGGPSASSGH
jgi:hypothetical protein